MAKAADRGSVVMFVEDGLRKRKASELSSRAARQNSRVIGQHGVGPCSSDLSAALEKHRPDLYRPNTVQLTAFGHLHCANKRDLLTSEYT